MSRVRYSTLADHNWSHMKFVARPLSSSWDGKLLPVIAITRTRLVVAAGSRLHVYSFKCASHSSDPPVIMLEGVYVIDRGVAHSNAIETPKAEHDISGLAFLPDEGRDRLMLAGFADGHVMRIILPENTESSELGALKLEGLYVGGDAIRGLSASGSLAFTLSNSGHGVLSNTSSTVCSSINVGKKSWSTYLSGPSNGSPFVAIGTSSRTPLAVYSIDQTTVNTVPEAYLSFTHREARASLDPIPSAVYGISGVPLSFPGNPGKTIVSGWFDGRLRIYDLRSPPRGTVIVHPGNNQQTRTLAPIMTLSDPWAAESIYTVSVGGGPGTIIGAGAARHSVVAFWDVRSPRSGWSVHAPGNDASPVYTLALEGSRAFGATQSRAFVLDFGDGAGKETYPSIERIRRRLDGSLKTLDGLHYEVTKYLHRNPMART